MNVTDRGFVHRIGVNNPNRIKLVLMGFMLHKVEGDASVPVSCGSVLKRTKLNSVNVKSKKMFRYNNQSEKEKNTFKQSFSFL